jgi:predicted esterase
MGRALSRARDVRANLWFSSMATAPTATTSSRSGVPGRACCLTPRSRHRTRRVRAGRHPRDAAPILDRFLDAELSRRNLPPSALALVGFSQGTMMSLHVGLRRPVAPAGIVGYSGMLVMPENVDVGSFATEIRSKPPVLLIHGDADQLIPVEALFHAAQSLAALGIPAQWHISSGVGHGIDQEGLRQGGEFLAKCFAAGK